MASLSVFEKSVMDRIAKEFFAMVDLCPHCQEKLDEKIYQKGSKMTKSPVTLGELADVTGYNLPQNFEQMSDDLFAETRAGKTRHAL